MVVSTEYLVEWNFLLIILFDLYIFLDLSQRVDSVKEENLKLKSENQVLGQYIENLMSASSVFQCTSPKTKKKLVILWYMYLQKFTMILVKKKKNDKCHRIMICQECYGAKLY